MGICLHIVTKCGIHAVVLAHVIHAVIPEDIGVHQSMAGLKAVGHDDVRTFGCIQFLLAIGAIRVNIRTVVWLTAGGKRKSIIWIKCVEVVILTKL